MNPEEIAQDIYPELPKFEKIHRTAEITNYLKLHHLAIFSLALAILLRLV